MTSTPVATAAPPRPDTREMIVVHNVFRRLIGDLPGLISGVTPGDRARAAILADTYTEVANALHHHHTNEDELLWPTLMARVDADRGFVLRAEEQHERVDELITRGNTQVEAFRADPSAAHRDALVATIRELDAAICEHMADEERYILPLVEEHMSVAEWEELGERGRASIPKDRLLIQLGWILEGLSPAEGKEFLHNMPFPARIAWRLLGKRAFGKEQRRVYGS